MDDIDVWTFPNFTPDEFRCKCNATCLHADVISHNLVAGLQQLRDQVGVPLTVNCGTRCLDHNAKVGGVRTSQHLEAYGTSHAADIRLPPGMPASYLKQLAELIPQFAGGGIGLYNNFIHLDDRGVKARWDRRE